MYLPQRRPISARSLRRDLIAVRLVVLLSGKIVLDARPDRLEVAQFQFLIHPPHLLDRVGHQFFVADLAELARTEQIAVAIEGVVHPRQRGKDVLLQTLAGRHLQALIAVETPPKVDRRGEDDVRVADDMDELRLGEHLQQDADAAGVRRRLQHDPLRVLQA